MTKKIATLIIGILASVYAMLGVGWLTRWHTWSVPLGVAVFIAGCVTTLKAAGIDDLDYL